MSSRAIQRLREERRANNLEPDLDEIQEDEEEEQQAGGAFLAMMDDSDSESEESDEEYDANEKETNSDEGMAAPTKDTVEKDTATNDKKQQKVAQLKQDPDEKEEEEDLDAILAEFESKDEAVEEDSKPSAPWFHTIVANMDARDLDIDHVMRTSLMGGSEEGPSAAASRRSRQSFLFGPPRDGWTRPPHYLGGGIGMTTNDNVDDFQVPWPYSAPCHDDNLMQASEQWQDPKHWFTFLHSDTYKKDLEYYERIQNSGDVNALALFVAQHPFVVEALLQLAMVLYRTSQSQEGLSLLRRSLWILECSSLPSFRPLDGPLCFMDYGQPANAPYFLTLFRMIQISGIQGCIRTSLAVSRFVLALDPLNDPMGVLLLMDYFALLSQNSKCDRLVVSLVDSKKITLNYKDDSSGKEYHDDLLELPNWAYSYALALYRLSQQSEDDDLSVKCDRALESAIQKFPAIVEQLLIKNDINTTGRSMRTDWPTALAGLRAHASKPVDAENYDPITQHAASQACDLISKIVVQRSHSLWSSDDVLFWLYKNCTNVVSKSESVDHRPQLSPTLIRYARVDPADYEDRFQTLPQDANPLDPGLLAPALAVDPNRRRFMRMPQVGRGQDDGAEALLRQQGGAGLVIGGPPTNVIDPDDPLVEVLWRSMLPWNTVEGVPPPRR